MCESFGTRQAAREERASAQGQARRWILRRLPAAQATEAIDLSAAMAELETLHKDFERTANAWSSRPAGDGILSLFSLYSPTSQST